MEQIAVIMLALRGLRAAALVSAHDELFVVHVLQHLRLGLAGLALLALSAPITRGRLTALAAAAAGHDTLSSRFRTGCTTQGWTGAARLSMA